MPDFNDLPAPLEQIDGAQALQALFGDQGPTPASPLGTAFLWLTCLARLEDDPEAIEAARDFSARPDDWDYREAARGLAAWAITGEVRPLADRPDVAHVQLVRAEGTSRLIDDWLPDAKDVLWLTLVGGEPYWYVWDLQRGPELCGP